MNGLTTEQIDQMVCDACRLERENDEATYMQRGDAKSEDVADVCLHVKALAAEIERLRAENATLRACVGAGCAVEARIPLSGDLDDSVSRSMVGLASENRERSDFEKDMI